MKKKWLAAVLAGALLAAALLSGCSSVETVKRLRFGVAGEGGIYREFGERFAALENETDNGQVELKATAGSAANLRLLTGEYLQLAIAQADLVQDAYDQTGIFADEEESRGFGAVAALYTETCQVVVRVDSDIQSIEDLHGRTVSIGAEESGSEQNARQILSAYGLIAGSMMGGPIGKMLIERHNLLATVVPEDDSLLVEEEMKHERHTTMYPAASFQLIVAMGIGTVLSRLLSLTGMTFPIYIGAMIAAAIIRNVGEYGGGYTVYMGEINDIGGICLSLFLGMAMITLKLWQLAELALPLIVLLAGQTLFMILYVVLVVFNIMGRDYDAAVIVSGTCGFGMGATPNAMANMQAICDKYSPSVKAYLLIPLVGSLFADFLNSLVITVFINFI